MKDKVVAMDLSSYNTGLAWYFEWVGAPDGYALHEDVHLTETERQALVPGAPAVNPFLLDWSELQHTRKNLLLAFGIPTEHGQSVAYVPPCVYSAIQRFCLYACALGVETPLWLPNPRFSDKKFLSDQDRTSLFSQVKRKADIYQTWSNHYDRLWNRHALWKTPYENVLCVASREHSDSLLAMLDPAHDQE